MGIYQTLRLKSAPFPLGPIRDTIAGGTKVLCYYQ
jgi:hypothetical protein